MERIKIVGFKGAMLYMEVLEISAFLEGRRRLIDVDSTFWVFFFPFFMTAPPSRLNNYTKKKIYL